ncbi:MAG TPA: long-chain-fatty-acid--CoA ligase [Candidatus Elarobacter sp.]|jgi:fatty-acyl-CoA synthase|nr:long-chain-fatty-acid--CoA ligase [Candidatus Elarobacter sp.]
MNQRHLAYWPKRRPKEFPVPVTSVAHNLATSAARFPDHPAIVYYDTPITYARVWREVEALAGHLEHRAGVKRGDRVVLYMQNSPMFVIAYYAILRANAVVVPLNPMLVAEELGTYIDDAGATVAITGQELLPRLAPHVGTRLKHVVVAAYSDYLERPTDLTLPPGVGMPRAPLGIPGVVAWGDALADTEPPSPITTGGDDMALLPYTSGTTGRPKGCVHTHRSLQTTLWATPMWAGMTSPGGRILSVLPYFHVTGMTGDMNGGLCHGGTIVMMTRWDPVTALTLLERYQCTSLSAISTMVVDLLAHPAYRSEALRSLVALGGGGAPLPAAVGKELSERVGINYQEGYGLTETIAMTHANPPDRTKLQCLGIPTFGVDSRVIDPETLEDLGPNETGEIIIAGSQVMREYWRQPDATAEAFIERDGKRFLRTGDLGYVDDEGYFFLVDRVKRMINTGGFKVWPAEVETKLFSHPAIKEACVIASLDPRRGEQVKAVVVLREGAQASAEEIQAWAREHMAAYKVPTEIAFVETLPRSATGKVAWRQLQEEEQRGARTTQPA